MFEVIVTGGLVRRLRYWIAMWSVTFAIQIMPKDHAEYAELWGALTTFHETCRTLWQQRNSLKYKKELRSRNVHY